MSKEFQRRHIGSEGEALDEMLKTIGVKSIDELISQTVPSNIRLKKTLNIDDAISENEYLDHIRKIASLNKVFRSFIGLGYYNTFTPSVIQRNIFENPGWYTSYTPYQAEISQGRLEALLNFQTMVMDLTSMPIANASLLDEATAAAEAMTMFLNNRTKEQVANNCIKFFVTDTCFPQTIDVLKTRAEPLGITLVIDHPQNFIASTDYFGMLIQFPDMNGEVVNWKETVLKAKEINIQVTVATDLLALTLLTPPGEWGADCVVGNSQRFGVPMGYGGPHAAFFACTENYKRLIPGRIIGISKDSQGKRALRMALQTREQHIKREKATSNICTAQALLATMAGMYAVYHGPKGVKSIAQEIHNKTFTLAIKLKNAGFKIINSLFFDTITIETTMAAEVVELATRRNINIRLRDHSHVSISVDETFNKMDFELILLCFSIALNKTSKNDLFLESKLIESSDLVRTSVYLKHSVFNSYHTETDMMRYIKKLENKDLSLVHSMISLGSCTMKLNAATEMIPVSWPEFANIHPFAPNEQTDGYSYVIKQLGKDLCEITGFSAINFQPNSGASGEYAGLMVIQSYHHSKGDQKRNVVLIPSSAHGTNPASAAMAGLKIVIVKCDENGNVDINDLKIKAEQYKDNLSALMVTYPSTHGVFEVGISEITNIIHQYGGLVYMDGANMNAQVGLTSPGSIGADVCHLNLHKTFAIPHGGGGPGVGAISVTKALEPFLPSHFHLSFDKKKSVRAVSAAPFGSALILLISYGYVKLLGAEGLTHSTKMAILNANYIKEKIKFYYPVLYTGKNGRCAHEMILDCSKFKKETGIEVGDIAKRLMDYGFHAPTVSFPVHDTLMIEPTESESKNELDRFCESMISIWREIEEIEKGKFSKEDNVFKNAPHTAEMITSDKWEHNYSRNKAVFPLHWIQENKFWPSVGKIDNAYGDRNLVCSCLETKHYSTISDGSIDAKLTGSIQL